MLSRYIWVKVICSMRMDCLARGGSSGCRDERIGRFRSVAHHEERPAGPRVLAYLIGRACCSALRQAALVRSPACQYQMHFSAGFFASEDRGIRFHGSRAGCSALRHLIGICPSVWLVLRPPVLQRLLPGSGCPLDPLVRRPRYRTGTGLSVAARSAVTEASTETAASTPNSCG